MSPQQPAYLDGNPTPDAALFRDSGFLKKDFSFDPLLINRAAAETRALGANGDHRIQDQWRRSTDVKALICAPALIEFLTALYGRRAFPFQTLNFVHGSQQKAHADTLHFSSDPAHFMCGVWIALEDVDEENGPLFYYPGSHRLPLFTMADTGGEDYVTDYEPFLQRQLDEHGFVARTVPIKKGEAVIWAANLAHGGAPIIDRARSRLSLVAHYYFEDCAYLTPWREKGERAHIRAIYDISEERFADQRRQDGTRLRPPLLVSLAARYRNLMGKTIAV